MSHIPAQLATQLVEAIGRPDDMVSVLADDAMWWITPAAPTEIMQSVSNGKEVIRGNMARVFRTLYNGDTMQTTIHSAISEGDLGAVRFTLSGEFFNGGKYTNEYCLCVETCGDAITKVWEYVDGAYALMQLQSAGMDITPAGAS
jgi:ketosteroid isomerase-like protein